MICITPKSYPDQFVFQREYSRGRVLNVGSNTDGAGLARDFGAVNVDLRSRDHVTGQTMPVSLLADSRALPFRAAFDTVVLGEILEHMERADAVLALRQAVAATRAGGRVVVTMPHDGRREAGTLAPPEGEAKFYAPGIYAYHYRFIGRLEMLAWLGDAGLEAETLSRILYCWGVEGSGVVARRKGEA